MVELHLNNLCLKNRLPVFNDLLENLAICKFISVYSHSMLPT